MAYTKALSNSCFYHIRLFRQICSSLADSWQFIQWLFLSHQHLFLCAWISWTLFCTALCLGIQLVFNESSMKWLGWSYTSILIHLHSVQMNFSNNSMGFLLNGMYGLNLPPWPSKPCTLVVCNISPTSCNITNTRSLRSFSCHQLSVLCHNLTFGSCAFGFSLQEFGIHYLSVSVNLVHFLLSDVI